MIDISRMTDTELEQLRAAVNTAIGSRREERKKKLWVDFLDAMEAYLAEFGEIRLTQYNDCVDLRRCNYEGSIPGRICSTDPDEDE